MVGASATASQPGVAQVTSKAAAVVVSRPDLVSAGVSARAQGARVEVEALRSAFASTWVNPDGSLTTEAHAGPIRFKDAKGVWKPVDLSLVAQEDGSVSVASHPDGARFGGSDADGAVLGSVTPAGGRSVVLGWPGKLGKPSSVQGNQARWADVTPGTDVVVESRRSGFETLVEVKDRAALDSASTAGVASWVLPLRTKGLTAKVTAAGGVDFVDAKGVVVSRFAPMLAWDARMDASGGPASTSPVTVAVAQKGLGKASLTLSLNPGWAADPGRVFPITIDPTYASGSLSPSYDAFVQTGFSSDQSSSTELRVGTYDGGSNVARSFLTFPNNVKGLQIQSANMSLYETYSYSCTAKTLSAYGVTGVASTATRWSSQPAIAASASGSISVARGYSSSCVGGRVNIPVTSLVQSWSSSTASSVSLALKASETDSYGWKKFYSSEASYDPVLTYTYNRKPNAATTPVVVGSTQYAGATYTASGSTVISSTATDPDGSPVRITFEVHSTTSNPSAATKLASCETPSTASGSSASCTPTPALPDNTTLYVRAAVRDDLGLWNGTWSPWTTFKTALATPAAPTLACTGYPDGSWTTTAPAAPVPCNVMVPTASGPANQPVTVNAVIDGALTPTTIATNQASGTFGGISVPLTDGAHSVKVWTVTASGLTSDPLTLGFGWGTKVTLYTPADKTVTNGLVRVRANGPPAGQGVNVTSRVQWRRAGDGTTPWADSTALQVRGTLGRDANGTVYVFPSAFGVWDASQVVTGTDARIPVLLEARVCLTYGPGHDNCSDPVSVTRVPHAFGSGYPTSAAGPGTVGLFTGELALDAQDVSVPGYAGDLSLSRSFASFTGDGSVANWHADPVTGVFGPGWTAALEGPDAGVAGSQIVDSTLKDGTIALTSGSDDPLVFREPGGGREQDKAGTYTPATADTLDAGTTLTLDGTGASATITVKEDDGTITVFTPAVTPVTGLDTTWVPSSVTEPGQSSATRYGRDSTGRVTRIVAAVPTGLTEASCPKEGTLVKGCRALQITYAQATTATSDTPGDVAGQVQKVEAILWDPDAKPTAAMATTTVATYLYDSSHRLVNVTDPRTGVSTQYGWDGDSTRLASITPAGLAPYRFTYEQVNGSGLRVKQVTRDAATDGGNPVALASFVYGIDATVNVDGLPDLTSGATKLWSQATPATTGYAVFDGDHPVTTTNPAGVTAADWPNASVQYVDDLGYTVNTAAYGAGDWQITATDYDTYGNTIRSLTAGATRTIRDAATAGAPLSPAQVDALSTQSVYNTEVKNGSAVVLPAGSRVESVTEPARLATLKTGVQARVRPRTTTLYDEGAPNGGINPTTGQAYSLATTVTDTVVDAAGGLVQTDSVTSSDYAVVVNGDGNGWELGTPTTVTTASIKGNTDGITHVTRYDTQGRLIEDRQPLSGGTDAGTTKTIYYTADANPTDSSCGDNKEWAGLICRTYPAAAPSSGLTLPGAKTTAYSMWLAPTEVIETSGAATRTTTTTYDTAGRQTQTTTVTAGVTGSTARPGTFTRYDQATGLIAYTGDLVGAGPNVDADATRRTTPTYDRWGRVTQNVNDQGVTTTTTYDAAGRVATVTDPKGIRTFTYDGTDANGKQEHRGMPTKVTITRGGTAGNLTFTGGYNANGAMTLQTMPGRITQQLSLDEVGQVTGLSYTGQVTTVTVSIDPVTGLTIYTPDQVLQDQPWLTWSRERDTTGKVAREYTGAGAATDGIPGVTNLADVHAPTLGQAIAYDRAYSYDVHGRLTTVKDRTAAATGAPADAASCHVRAYTLDKNGRRTDLVEKTYDPTCAGTPTATTTSTYAYDTADRPTTGTNGVGAYDYDLFGRQTTLPSVDAPTPAQGNITLGYYDDDLIRSVSQGGTTTTFTLTIAGNRKDQTTTDATGTVTGKLTRYYTDDGDNPAWEVLDEGAGLLTTTRYVGSLAGDLGASITDDGAVELTVANPHGDTATTIQIPTGQSESDAAVAITGWADYTEYGTPKDAAAATAVAGTAGYGWLGAKQRSTTTDTAGLTLMGDRLYNPTRGLFTSIDPEAGGNENDYNYPNDPINMYDLDGHWGWGDTFGAIALGVCIFASAGACAVAAVAVTAYSAVSNYRAYRSGKKSAAHALRSFAFDAALSFLPGARGARLIGRHGGRWLARGLRGTARALRGSLSRSTYVARHRASGIRRYIRGVSRHSRLEFRANWRVRPRRTALRTSGQLGSWYYGSYHRPSWA